VDADDARVPLIDDRVDRDRGLSRLAIADDQLPLAAPDRNHPVDRLEPRLQRLLDRRAVDDARGDPLQRREILRFDRTLSVLGMPERVRDAADELLPRGHLHDAPRALDAVPVEDLVRLAEEDGSDVVLLEIQREAHDAVRELKELPGHHLLEAVNPRDAI